MHSGDYINETIPYRPWMKPWFEILPLPCVPRPPILPAPQPFTPDEIDALRRMARKAIDKDAEKQKREQIEKLADELGYDLVPKMPG